MGKVGGDSRGLVGRGEAGEGLISVHMRPRTSNESETQTHTHWAEIALKVKVAQSCPTLCDPLDCIPPSSSIYGILQARILEWVAISFSRESSQPRDRTQVSHIAGRRLNL